MMAVVSVEITFGKSTRTYLAKVARFWQWIRRLMGHSHPDVVGVWSGKDDVKSFQIPLATHNTISAQCSA